MLDVDGRTNDKNGHSKREFPKLDAEYRITEPCNEDTSIRDEVGVTDIRTITKINKEFWEEVNFNNLLVNNLLEIY
jgi:hypothetical protein